MDIFLVGNCQLGVASKALQALCPTSNINYITTNDFLKDKNIQETFKSNIKPNDYLIYSPAAQISKILENDSTINKFIFPTITNSTEMQDCIYVGKNREIRSGIGIYHSFIILCSYITGLTENQALSMFNPRIYQKLGYFQLLKTGSDQFLSIMTQFGLTSNAVNNLAFNNNLMHTVNHPRLILIEAVVKSLLKKLKIPHHDIDVCNYMSDPLLEYSSFPTLIDTKSGKAIDPTTLFFKKDGKSFSPKIVTLNEFISLSYQSYRNHDCDELTTDRLSNGRIDDYRKIFTEELATIDKAERSHNPYKSLPNHCFWRRSISRVSPQEVDPVIEGSIKLKSSDKVATAGSCFAQHISNRLQRNGFSHLITEQAPSGAKGDSSSRKGFGNFSARYGNVYTARQLLQLFDRAFGNFIPTINHWMREDGVFVDPFRPQVEPSGFSSKENLEEERKKHLKAVKIMFEELDVFVFTLGLTECWESISDGSILPLAPGVAGGEMNSEMYAFRNFSKQEVQEDLASFIEKLKCINPSAKIILTVSPVPLVATYEKRHVLVSNTVSKSVLRVVAEEISNAYNNVHYFPSFEIITGNFNKGRYFKEDLREIDESGVDHVMRLFMQHYTSLAEQATTPKNREDLLEKANFNNEEAENILQEMNNLSEVFCDEEALDDQ
ncbi:GSCFA domain-containing protein [uncultured Gilvimarinus sp.]|mgnify:CR=1 FL=1|jgi:hypothetical protein|uniref:GSCFA domain-containing protein n=1 Tax=uncultured Gilvimarinus sp. TaxID=1689143 RepID=UPI0030D8319D